MGKGRNQTDKKGVEGNRKEVGENKRLEVSTQILARDVREGIVVKEIIGET